MWISSGILIEIQTLLSGIRTEKLKLICRAIETDRLAQHKDALRGQWKSIYWEEEQERHFSGRWAEKTSVVLEVWARRGRDQHLSLSALAATCMRWPSVICSLHQSLRLKDKTLQRYVEIPGFSSPGISRLHKLWKLSQSSQKPSKEDIYEWYLPCPITLIVADLSPLFSLSFNIYWKKRFLTYLHQ